MERFTKNKIIICIKCKKSPADGGGGELWDAVNGEKKRLKIMFWGKLWLR